MSAFVFLVEFTVLSVCFLVHITLWRWRRPRNHGLALVAIFSIPLACTFACLLFLHVDIRLNDLFPILLLHLSLSSAYILTYPAIEGLSLSLVCLHALGAECAGLTANELLLRVDAASLRDTKIQDLLNSGLIVGSAENLRVTTKGKYFVGPFVLLRRLLGLPPGQG